MRSARIFVIEDDDDLRGLITLLLGEEGYDVFDFARAREGLRAIERGQPADLILLDLMMPDMSGWEFCEQRLGSSQLATVPLIVITARRDAARPPGVSDVLYKPFDADVLLATIARLITGSPEVRT